MKAPLVCSYRVFLAFLAFLGVFLCYAQRREEFLSSHFFHESEGVDSTIIVSFGLSYVLTHVPASIAVNLVGPKRFFAFIIFFSSIFTGLLPLFPRLKVTMLLRFLIGAAQGGLWPTIFRFWSMWVPASERTTLLSFQIAAPSISLIVSLIIFNRLNKLSSIDNLPFMYRYGPIYYFVFGALGIIWSIIWLIFASDTPMTNKHISANEGEYIRVCKVDEKIQDTDTRTPWGSIFLSRAFWCIMISMFFREISVYALWTVVPKYMNDVVLVSIRDSDLLSILLYTVIFITVISTGGLSDFIIRKKYLKRVNARKVFHSIGALATAACLLIISFLDSRHRNLVVSLYIIGIVFSDLMKTGGYFVNIQDFSGIHSGVVLAMCETFSSIGSMCAIHITNAITKHRTKAEWRIVSTFYTTTFIILALVFSLLARGEPESWARDERINNNDDANNESMQMNSE